MTSSSTYSTPDLSALNGKRVFLTGINGFLGSRTAGSLLDVGAIPIGLVRNSASNEELKKVGIQDKVQLLELSDNYDNIDHLIQVARPDVVIHIASASRVKEDANGMREMVSANILFPSLILEAMTRNNVRGFVNIGTSWQSCDGSRFNPFNYYAATKQAIEDVIEHFSINSGMRAATLRLFDTYGPGDPRSKILNLIIRHTLSGAPLDMSPGNQKVHLVHISDVATAVMIQVRRVLQRTDPGHETFDLPSKKATSLREIAKIVEAAIGKPCPINWGGREYRVGEIMNPVVSNPVLPDFIPATELRDGIQDVIQSSQSAEASLQVR